MSSSDLNADRVTLQVIQVLHRDLDAGVSQDTVQQMILALCRETRHPGSIPSKINESIYRLIKAGEITQSPKGLVPIDLDGPPVQVSGAWGGDPYERELSLGLPCFSRGYVEGHELCSTCPVAGWCAAGLFLRHTVVGDILEVQDVEEEVRQENERIRQETLEQANLAMALARQEAEEEQAGAARPLRELVEVLNETAATGPEPVATFTVVDSVPGGTFCAVCRRPISGKARFKESVGHYHIACEGR